MDGQIARLMWALKRRGLYDDAVIVFSGDHGEGLLQHKEPGHGIVWNEQLQVPLIFKFPRADGARRGRSRDLASLIDILPTIVHEAALPLPGDQFDGIDLLKQTRSSVLSQREVRLTTGWRRPLYALTTARWKYFHYDKGDHPDRLYDLSADPHETDDVIEQHADVAAVMRAEIVELVGKGKSSSHLRTDKPVPDSVQEQMRQLGYTN
jgi:arylsulfatase A-like enzyme